MPASGAEPPACVEEPPIAAEEPPVAAEEPPVALPPPATALPPALGSADKGGLAEELGAQLLSQSSVRHTTAWATRVSELMSSTFLAR
jgi:hypothetical protein